LPAAGYDHRVADRILVYGVTGSGKTTIASQIAERTGIGWHSVDDLTWDPGWVPVSAAEQGRRIAAICAGERWILDTAYGSWRETVLARTDLIVALDYPRWVSLGRLVRRTVMRAVDHRPICNGNTESFRQAFSRDSIIVWHFRSFTRKRKRIREWAANPPVPEVVRLTSPRAARHWLATLSADGTAEQC
jgi:adenylate kinase family enzyme